MATSHHATDELLTVGSDSNTDHPRPGFAVFIVNQKQVESSGPFSFITRAGAEKDLDHLKYIFLDRFGFQWLNEGCHENLTLRQWDHKYGERVSRNPTDCCIKCCIQGTDHTHTDYRYFCIAFSSHGCERDGRQHVIFSDGHSVLLSEVYEALSDENCPTLKGKSRLVILQTCRSDKSKPENLDDKGVEVQVEYPLDLPVCEENFGCTTSQEHDDGPKPCRFTVTKVPETAIPTSVVMEYPPNNFLVLYAGTSGKKTKRNTDDGSWMLYEMVNVLSSMSVIQHPVINLLSVITRTAQRVSHRETTVYETDKAGNQKFVNGELVVDHNRSGLKNAVCVQFCLEDPVCFHAY